MHKTATTEEEYIALLEAHRLLTLVAKECHSEEIYQKLIPIMKQEYRFFLICEATECELINPAILDCITLREVAAGRLDENDEFRTFAAAGGLVLGDTAVMTAHKCWHGNWFCWGMIAAAILSTGLINLSISPLWLIGLGLIIGSFLNYLEQKRIKEKIIFKRSNNNI